MYRPIPSTKPYFSGKELAYVQRLFESGRIGAGGAFTKQAEASLGALTGCAETLLVNSCSSALEVAACLLDFEPGDEFIVPSYTFVTTVSSFARFGLKPVFADIRADTCNIDETAVEALITRRTRAVVGVHYGGVPAEIDALAGIAERHGLVVIEDAAHALGSRYRGRKVGSISPLATFSFHETKNLICGEGGALCVNDATLVDRAHVIIEKGTNRRQHLKGHVDMYTWVDMGASYGLTEIAAAVLAAQLEMNEKVTQRRRQRFERYMAGLARLAFSGELSLPVVPEHCDSNYHLFYFLLSDRTRRPALLEFLRERGIEATFHYIPLHSSPQGQALGGGDHALPVTDQVSASIVRLPLYPALTDAEQDWVIDAVEAFFKER